MPATSRASDVRATVIIAEAKHRTAAGPHHERSVPVERGRHHVVVAEGPGWTPAEPAGPNASTPGTLMLAGSCSAATLGQIARAEAAGVPVLRLDGEALKAGATSG